MKKWFAKWFCTHEVNLDNLELPLCKHCGNQMPYFDYTSGIRQHPDLKKWYAKRFVKKHSYWIKKK